MLGGKMHHCAAQTWAAKGFTGRLRRSQGRSGCPALREPLSCRRDVHPKQQVTGTLKMREVSNLQCENCKLQRELKATGIRAELIAKENRCLRAVQEGMVAGGRALAKEALDPFDVPAVKPVIKAKAATKTRVTSQTKAAVEAVAHAPKRRSVVPDLLLDEPVTEHQIKPKDDA